MKKDKTYWLLESLKLIFFLAVPVLLFILKCTTITEQGGTKFIIGCSGYIVAIIIYIAFKKIFMKNYLADLNGKVINFTTQLETETDQTKIPLIEKALSKCMIIRSCFTVIPVIIIIGLALLMVKSLESDLVKLYSTLGLCAISYILGFICLLVQNATITSKNRS